MNFKGHIYEPPKEKRKKKSQSQNEVYDCVYFAREVIYSSRQILKGVYDPKIIITAKRHLKKHEKKCAQGYSSQHCLKVKNWKQFKWTSIREYRAHT